MERYHLGGERTPLLVSAKEYRDSEIETIYTTLGQPLITTLSSQVNRDDCPSFSSINLSEIVYHP